MKRGCEANKDDGVKLLLGRVGVMLRQWCDAIVTRSIAMMSIVGAMPAREWCESTLTRC